MDWRKLVSTQRLDDLVVGGSVPAPLADIPRPAWLAETRTPAERDYDRLRFAAPVRRLGDKTQVFPLERNDSVRNRLTHSEEVSALARSIGSHIAHRFLPDRGVKGLERAIPATLAAVGLAHDLGNPPFGHQGEEAMRRWFGDRREQLFGEFDDRKPPGSALEIELEGAREMRTAVSTRPALREDFIKFEGNAQTMRLVMRLQASTNGFGLNLTCGTLAALMKYVVPSDAVDVDGAAGARKPGFFQSEAAWIAKVREEVGLSDFARHPLAGVLEACDDIAYSVIDAEDSVKKGLVSFSDLIEYLDAAASDKDTPEEGKEAIRHVAGRSRDDHRAARSGGRLPPAELNDVSMQKFRVHAIGTLASALAHTWTARYDDIVNGSLTEPLLKAGHGSELVKVLKRFDREHAFRHQDVLAVEVQGYNTLQELMSMLWRGIVERDSFTAPGSKRSGPFADLAYRHISENYRGAFERPDGRDACLPIRYREIQLLADMVSGMTDSYAVALHGKLGEHHVGASYRKV